MKQKSTKSSQTIPEEHYLLRMFTGVRGTTVNKSIKTLSVEQIIQFLVKLRHTHTHTTSFKIKWFNL